MNKPYRILAVGDNELTAIAPLPDANAREAAMSFCAGKWQGDGDIDLLASFIGEPIVDRKSGELVGMRTEGDGEPWPADLHHLVRVRVQPGMAKRAKVGGQVRLG